MIQNQVLQGHIIACEKRGARLERLSWAIGATVMTVLGLLLKAYFHFGP